MKLHYKSKALKSEEYQEKKNLLSSSYVKLTDFACSSLCSFQYLQLRFNRLVRYAATIVYTVQTVRVRAVADVMWGDKIQICLFQGVVNSIKGEAY